MTDGLKEGLYKIPTDNINPTHYKVGGIQTIEFIKAKMSKEQFAGYLLGNVIKYTSRYQFKNGIEDLEKAKWYLDRMIAEAKGEGLF